MRRIVGKREFLLLIYVADILVIADTDEIERVKEFFVREFTWITTETSRTHSYLGMQISFHDGCVTVDMKHYIEKLFIEDGDLEEYTSPAARNVFSVNPAVKILDEKDRKAFHTVVAKLLFLSKRARTEILTANGFCAPE